MEKVREALEQNSLYYECKRIAEKHGQQCPCGEHLDQNDGTKPCIYGEALAELKAAEEALEKQKAKKVEYIDTDCSYFDCPECGAAISYMDEIETHKYCLNCGQKLDWKV